MVYVIAECGSCHDGDLNKALELIWQARRVGANAVKFQYWSDADALADRRRVPQYYRDVYERYALPTVWLPALAARAEKFGLDFMCTTYLPQDVALIAQYVKHFKIASFEAGALDLFDAHLPFLQNGDRWLIVSLGMGAEPLDWDVSGWNKLAHSALHHRVMRYLHCVSAYPAPPESLRLSRINYLDGFSDHSAPSLTWTGALAVAAGARIIEAHLRVHSNVQNPDYAHAMIPEQFIDYVANIRFAERCVGDDDNIARMHAVEAEMAQYRVRTGDDEQTMGDQATTETTHQAASETTETAERPERASATSRAATENSNG